MKYGDIVSYRHGETVITHRITEIIENDGKKQYKTKGDNNNAEDSGTVSDNVVEGKVIKIFPTIGKITILLQNKIVIILIILLFILYFHRSAKKRLKKEERRIKRLEYEAKNNYNSN